MAENAGTPLPACRIRKRLGQHAEAGATKRKKLKDEDSSFRNPVILVEGIAPFFPDATIKRCMQQLLHPTSVIDITTQNQYKLNWAKSDPLVSPELCTEEMNEFMEKAKNLLEKPLNSLFYDENIQRWTQQSASLNADEQYLIDGFIYDMASQRGRGSVKAILEGLVKTNDRIVHNAGGRNIRDEPAVRLVHFSATPEEPENNHSPASTSDEDSSPGVTYRISSPGSSQMNLNGVVQEQDEESSVVNKVKSSHHFVPDIVIEERKDPNLGRSEPLLVEVKKGKTLTTYHEAQLKYQLLPSAIKQGKSLGLLICAKKAILMKYTITSDNFINLEQSEHNFGNNSFSDDFIKLLCCMKGHLN